ncbi:hypothetical protein IT571_07400, partial [Candidatus Sumerlaeota bacterium]|nr:hypothetical protein [Candidatus Sumerlaeota bacterium]
KKTSGEEIVLEIEKAERLPKGSSTVLMLSEEHVDGEAEEGEVNGRGVLTTAETKIMPRDLLRINARPSGSATEF